MKFKDDIEATLTTVALFAIFLVTVWIAGICYEPARHETADKAVQEWKTTKTFCIGGLHLIEEYYPETRKEIQAACPWL